MPSSSGSKVVSQTACSRMCSERLVRVPSGTAERRDSGLPEGFDPTAPYDMAAAREFRARPSPAEVEAERLHAAGAFNVDAPEHALLSTAKAADPAVRARALQMLAVQNTDAGRQALTHALDDDNVLVRNEALSLLLSLGASPDAVRGVRDLLGHTDPGIRMSALMAIDQLSADDREFHLKRALGDDDRGIRDMAAQLLEKNAKKKNDNP